MTTDPTFRPSDSTRFEAAIRSFDRENSLDPKLEIVEGLGRPRELLYAERLTDWVLKLCPDAPEELRLAARCQHICRWMVPRGSHEMRTRLERYCARQVTRRKSCPKYRRSI